MTCKGKGARKFAPVTAQTMQVAILEAYKMPFRLMQVARPDAGPGQVLVRIAASGVNPLDTKIHDGAAPHARQVPPAVLGLDLAGTVETVGPGVTLFRPGDKVYGMTGGVGGLQGSLAEFAAVDARLCCADARQSQHARGRRPSAYLHRCLGRIGRPCRCQGRADSPDTWRSGRRRPCGRPGRARGGRSRIRDRLWPAARLH